MAKSATVVAPFGRRNAGHHPIWLVGDQSARVQLGAVLDESGLPHRGFENEREIIDAPNWDQRDVVVVCTDTVGPEPCGASTP